MNSVALARMLLALNARRLAVRCCDSSVQHAGNEAEQGAAREGAVLAQLCRNMGALSFLRPFFEQLFIHLHTLCHCLLDETCLASH